MLDMTLSALDQFLSYVRSIPRYSDEQEAALVARVRQGDSQARHELVESLLPVVVSYARSYAAQFSHLALLDIVQMGVETLLRRLDDALHKPCPQASLLESARWDMLKCCQRQNSLITTPLGADSEHRPSCHPVLSLDMPVREGSEMMYADFLPASPDGQCSEEQDHTALYEALSRLSEDQRVLLARRYGLLGYAPTSRSDLAQELLPELPVQRARGVLSNRERRALSALQVLMSASYLPETQSTPDEYYTAVELRDRYGVKRTQLRYWIWQGRLMRYPAPPDARERARRYVYAKDEVDRLLEQLERTSANGQVA